MGDILHAMPAVHVLRLMFPESEIGWVVESRWSELLRSRADAAPLSADQPLVHSVHIVDTRKWRKNLLSGEARQQALAALREVRHKKYDIAVDFQGAIKSAAVARLSGASTSFGFADPWEKPASLLYTDKIETRRTHVVDRNAFLAAALPSAVSERSSSQRIATLLPSSSADWSNKRLSDLGFQDRFAILNPGAGWGAKQWPSDRYVEVARTLAKNGIRSLLNYGPGEEELAKQIERQADGYAIAAQFSISELIAVTRRASLFIGGDTGPLHLAAALKIPVVALFGPTDPARTGPYGTRSVVLRDPSSVTSHKRNRETEAGLKNITSEQVIAAARQLLEEGRRA